MVRWASAHAAKGDGAYARPHSGARDVELPKQIFGEFHLDRDVSEQNKYSMVPPDKVCSSAPDPSPGPIAMLWCSRLRSLYPLLCVHVPHCRCQAHVGQRLRHFLDEMFIRGGYMVLLAYCCVLTTAPDYSPSARTTLTLTLTRPVDRSCSVERRCRPETRIC